MKRATLLAVCLLVTITPTLAQDRALISGDAEDKQDAPVVGVKVTLKNDSLRIDRTTTTNADGFYFFAEVEPAEGYVIGVIAPGMSFAPEQVKFDVEVGETRHVLPSFIGEKGPASSWNLQRHRHSDGVLQSALPASLRESPKPQLLAVTASARWNNPFSALISDAGPGIAEQDKAPSQAAPGAQSSQNAAPSQQHAAGTGQHPAKGKGTVESPKAPIDTLSTAVSTVVTSNQLRNLPLYNRNFLAVGLLVSSTHDVPAWSELKDTTFSISGQRPTSNAFLLDGMDNEASSSNQAIPFQVNEAVQEFRVTTGNSDAQFGRNIGGVVNIITRRGTAKFHGSVFGFFADNSFDASSRLSVYGGSGLDRAVAFAGPVNAPPATNMNNPAFAPIYQPATYNQYISTIQYINSNYSTNYCASPTATSGSPNCLQTFDGNAFLAHHDSHTQPFSSQQFGAAAGGSFLKRWYWFGDYEGTRINNPNPIFERVPSSYDRSHLQQFAGQPGYADAAYAQAVLSLYPQSNVQAIPDVLEFYQGQAPNYTNVDNYLGRLDFTQSSLTNWTFRYNLQDLSQLHDDSLPASSRYPGNGAQRAVLNQNLVGTFTHQFSATLTNVIRGGFTQFQVKETPQDAGFDPAKAGLPSGALPTYLLSGLDPQYAGASPGTNGAWGGWYDALWSPPSNIPIIAPSLDGLFPFARIGAPLDAPGMRRDRELELADNLVWFKGKHTVRTGFDLRRIQNVFDNGGYSRGMVVSGDIGEFTSDSESCVTCSPNGAFSAPSYDYALRQPSPYDTTFHSYVVAAYIQDTWRLRPNVTINLGVRYEYFSPPSEVNHQLWNYDPTANGLVRQDETVVSDPYGQTCNNTTYFFRSVYSSTRLSLPWNCNPNGNGSFVVANTTNFEPRIGLAWSTPNGKTVVRAGFGIFYDQVPASLMAELAFNRPTPYSQNVPQAVYGQNFESSYCFGQCGLGNSTLTAVSSALASSQAASIPFSISAVDPSALNNPMTRQVNFTVARQISTNVSAEVAYIGNFMGNLPTLTNTGFNNEWFCTFSAQGNLGQPCDAFSYLPIFTHANNGYGNYNAFVAKVIMRQWHGLQVRGSYTYSRALDNASQATSPLIPGPIMTQVNALNFYGLGSPLQWALGLNVGVFQPPPGVFTQGAVAANFSAVTDLLTAGVSTTGVGHTLVTPYTIPQDPYNYLSNDYGPSDFNQANRFILEYTWDIPTRSRSAWLNGWMLSGVFIAESGQPFTIFSGPVGGEITQRVSLDAPLSITGNPNQYFANPAAISLPGPACMGLDPAYSPYVIQRTEGIRAGVAGTPCLGTTGRNQFTGPGYVDYDMAVQKQFKLRENIALSLRAESYNLFNHPNYYNPISSFSLDGVSQYSQFGQIKSAHNPRQFQFAIRLNW